MTIDLGTFRGDPVLEINEQIEYETGIRQKTALFQKFFLRKGDFLDILWTRPATINK